MGLGDVFDFITTITGIKWLIKRLTPEGKDCGCERRQKQLNEFGYKLSNRIKNIFR